MGSIEDFRTIQHVSGRSQNVCSLFGLWLLVPAMRLSGWTTEGRGDPMSANSTRLSSGRRSAYLAIGVGGLVAGALDLTQACILFGPHIPLAIAGGLLGRRAFAGSAGDYVLGVCLHFFIALSAATVYYLASRRLVFMTEHPLVCGLFFGIAVELVMSYIVLPLSALHARGPYDLHDVLLGLGVHMVVIGLPISFSVWRFGPARTASGLL
jgi:hypothetical protein